MTLWHRLEVGNRSPDGAVYRVESSLLVLLSFARCRPLETSRNSQSLTYPTPSLETKHQSPSEATDRKHVSKIRQLAARLPS